MCRIIDLSFLRMRLALVALCMVMVSASGCAVMKTAQDNTVPLGVPNNDMERNIFYAAKGDDVIGQLAFVRLEKGDTLPDIARHFGLGVTAISAANPGVDVWVPKAGDRVLLPLSFILPDAPRKGIVVNLATMRLFQFKGDGRSVATYPVGVGTTERPTPTGRMFVARKVMQPTWYVPTSIAEDHRKKGDPLPAKVPPGPQNPLGECALYLSKPSYLIHGTNKPASIGLRASNGCLRLYPENVKRLFDETPVKTPVAIVNQPYLIGESGGVLYLEAHKPFDGCGPAEVEKINARLRSIEKKSGRTVDWKKVQEVEAEGRGIPIPVSDAPIARGKDAAPQEIAHPRQLYGKPETPELRLNAWYVLAAELPDAIEALRLAAIINHQGPPIPARVLSKGQSHRVIAGPFGTVEDAREAMRRLRIDLEIEGVLIEPVRT